MAREKNRRFSFPQTQKVTHEEERDRKGRRKKNARVQTVAGRMARKTNLKQLKIK